jgi:hypothetical protein
MPRGRGRGRKHDPTPSPSLASESPNLSSDSNSGGYYMAPIQFLYQIKKGVWAMFPGLPSDLIEKLNQ